MLHNNNNNKSLHVFLKLYEFIEFLEKNKRHHKIHANCALDSEAKQKSNDNFVTE